MLWSSFEDFVVSNNINYKKNVELKKYSYFQTGGNLNFLVIPESKDELVRVVTYMRLNTLPYKIVGNTTNLLFLDDAIYSCLIDIRRLDHIAYLGEGIFEVDSGSLLPVISREFLKKGLSGAEGLEGIPGTIGAAILMNAGAYGTKISDILKSVDVLSLNGQIETYDRSDLIFSHRNSTFRSERNHDVILSCRVQGKKGDTIKIYNKMSLYHNKRHKYQEWMYPNLGSLFVGSIYRLLATRNLSFKVKSGLYIFFNYKFRIFRRESPDNRIWLNNLVMKSFGVEIDEAMFSPKDLNTLINSGQHTNKILDHIEVLKKLTHNSIELENEIVNPF